MERSKFARNRLRPKKELYPTNNEYFEQVRGCPELRFGGYPSFDVATGALTSFGDLISERSSRNLHFSIASYSSVDSSSSIGGAKKNQFDQSTTTQAEVDRHCQDHHRRLLLVVRKLKLYAPGSIAAHSVSTKTPSSCLRCPQFHLQL